MHHGAGHILEIFLLFALAQLLGWVCHRVQTPTVIGQIVAGIILGPSLLGLVHESAPINLLVELGIIFLLFTVGLEIRSQDLLSAGKQAVLVACIGITLPFIGGYFASLYFDFAPMAALFIGTAFTATSVGITASVLQELHVLSRNYTRIILGAAVIDDIIGLIALSVISGMAETGSVEVMNIFKLAALSIGLLAAVLFVAPHFEKIRLEKLPLRSPYYVAICLGLGLAAFSASVGMAPIIGAFLGGMLLAGIKEDYNILKPVHSVSRFLGPIFFAMVGAKLDISVLMDAQTLLIGITLAAVAMITKCAAGLGVIKDGVIRAGIVGTGMMPRGEVVLIIVALGLSTGVLTQKAYASLLVVVMLTTFLTPLILRPLIRRAEKKGRKK